MTRLMALLIVLAFAVTSGAIPALAQPKEPAAKSDKASPSRKQGTAGYQQRLRGRPQGPAGYR